MGVEVDFCTSPLTIADEMDVFSAVTPPAIGLAGIVISVASDAGLPPKFRSHPISNVISDEVLVIGLGAGITCILFSHADTVDPDTGVIEAGELVF